jgi:hypothetical protein
MTTHFILGVIRGGGEVSEAVREEAGGIVIHFREVEGITAGATFAVAVAYKRAFN